MAIKIVNTNSGSDFSSCVPAILCDSNGDYIAISGVSGGTGDLVGPGSATADAVAIYSGGTGKIVKNSVFTTSGNNMTIPGTLTVSGLSTTTGMSVVDGGGLVSAASNQSIGILASSGVIIGGGHGAIDIGTLYGLVKMSSSDGTNSTYCYTLPTEAVIGSSTPGGSVVIQLAAGEIVHVGNIRPNNNELTYLGVNGHAYLQVEAKTFVMKSPDGSRWGLKVSNAGVVSADKLPV